MRIPDFLHSAAWKPCRPPADDAQWRSEEYVARRWVDGQWQYRKETPEEAEQRLELRTW